LYKLLTKLLTITLWAHLTNTISSSKLGMITGLYIKYIKLTSVKVTKSHIQNSRAHFTRAQSDRTSNWLPLQTHVRTPFNLLPSRIIP